MIIESNDNICVIGLHRSGTSTVSYTLSNTHRQYCGELTSALDFLKLTFPLDKSEFLYFKPWQEVYSVKYPGIEKYESFRARLEYIERATNPKIFKILVNELADMDVQDINYLKSTLSNYKVVLCKRPFREIIISQLVRPAVRNWLVINKHYDIWPDGVEKNKLTSSTKIDVPLNKDLVEKILKQKPKHIHLMKQIEEFVTQLNDHVVIDYQDDLENHPWLKPYYTKSNQQYIKNPFTYNFLFDIEQIIEQVKINCNYWY